MKNIFENAYFGKVYVSKDETKYTFCSFTKNCNNTLARLYRENWGVVFFNLDGHVHSGCEFGKGIDFTIVSEWQEEINEEELNELAEKEFPYGYTTSLYADEDYELTNDLRDAFKAGYHKAMKK